MSFGTNYEIAELQRALHIVTGERDAAREERDQAQFQALKFKQLYNGLLEQMKDKTGQVEQLSRALADMSAEMSAHKQMAAISSRSNNFSRASVVHGSQYPASGVPKYNTGTFSGAQPGAIIPTSQVQQPLGFKARHTALGPAGIIPVDKPPRSDSRVSKEYRQLAASVGLASPEPQMAAGNSMLQIEDRPRNTSPSPKQRSQVSRALQVAKRAKPAPVPEITLTGAMSEAITFPDINTVFKAYHDAEKKMNSHMRTHTGLSSDDEEVTPVPLPSSFAKAPEAAGNELDALAKKFPTLAQTAMLGGKLSTELNCLYRLVDGWVKKYCTVVVSNLSDLASSDDKWLFYGRCVAPFSDKAAGKYLLTFCGGSDRARILFIQRIIIQWMFESLVHWNALVGFVPETDAAFRECGDKPLNECKCLQKSVAVA